ncbi:unnamed protein product [Spirodela intermedia]|uniref:Uncharacterized protein n=1 Tax=Spirodela intermedia TaxID=51605 RepID=A0A7I8I8X5_SPIIN|nr:unnamed protein product [Spirodela intermedia]CAA6654127.1 unnamed protein product [Spirodela intermedia]
MATVRDISLAAAINIFSAFIFLILFAILRLQPINDRVYFPKWSFVTKFVNCDFKSYLRFLSWMPEAIKMPELELIDHAGLDSAVYIRIYLLGLKIFVPFMVFALCILVPFNCGGRSLEDLKDVTFSDIDKLQYQMWHLDQRGLTYFTLFIIILPDTLPVLGPFGNGLCFSFWTFYVLYKEYKVIAFMRLRFLASERRRPDQFTVLVRNVPPDTDETINEHLEHFFCVNHPDHYLTHQVVYNANYLSKLVEKKKKIQNWLDYYEIKYSKNSGKRPSTKTGFLGLCGKRVDALEYYTQKLERVINDPKAIMPVAFVSFKTRWGAAVCAQTQQSSNPTLWLTEWAPEPCDVYWPNLAIPYVKLTIRRLIMAVALFFLTFFFMIPIAFVQSLASLEGIERVVPFLSPIMEIKVIKSFIQGFLPGIALKIFLILLPKILMTMSKIEGFVSLSTLERRSAAKYYLFILVNVFLGSIITGTAFEQLNSLIKQSASNIPITVGVAIPLKATFFITYIMVDGWSGVAAEILRVKPLIMYHLRNTFIVKTEQDRQQAMDPGSLEFASSEPRIQFYFLLGLVYSVVTPILLPFIVIFFGFAYVVFRHQIINVYHQQYESGAAFWPDVHRRILYAMIISQILLMGLMTSKKASDSTPLLLVLPILTVWFHVLCKTRFEPAFVKFPLQDAMVRDTLERATDPAFNLKAYLHEAYIHPVFKNDNIEQPAAMDEEESNPLVRTRRSSHNTASGPVKHGFEFGS